MSTADTMNELLTMPTLENYASCSNDVSEISEITNLNIESATKLSFDYAMPNDRVDGQVVIWEGMIIDESKTPVYRANLSGHKGHVVVDPHNLNFLKGAYTVAVTADRNLNTVAATQSIIAGQKAQQGMSSLIVINKSLTSINIVFNRPANAIASSDITWLILREGSNLGQGQQKAYQPSTPGSSSGLVPITFPAGTLEEGKTYNVVLNPGYSTAPFTAGYVFKYIIQ